ncbi:LAFA_0D13916g1_1 [Lachancea sp. 'fantastica']|nr:LAFA_0D13916g1_1 [Lachancea sp. 'fantastica']
MVVPKRYVRVSVVLLLLLGVIWLLDFFLGKQHALLISNSSEKFMMSITLEDPADYDPVKVRQALRSLPPDRNLVVSVGVITCFYVGTFWEYCPGFYKYKEGEPNKALADKTDLKIIKKDLKRTRSLRLVGASHYFMYETVSVSKAIEHFPDSSETLFALCDFNNLDMKVADGTVLPSNMFYFSMVAEQSIQDWKFVCDVDIFFGPGAVDPRSGWSLSADVALKIGPTTKHISLKRPIAIGEPSDSPRLHVGPRNTFKIVQLADLHFSVGNGHCRDEFPQHEECQADPKTLTFIEQVLDSEKPQLVVFTGDQIMGQECYLDSASALLKVVKPVIDRKIPYAMVWGNHDDEGSLNRWQLSELARSLPHSIFQIGDKDTNDNTFGVGNYAHHIYDQNENPVSALYFLDAHKYSPNAKAYPGYDWIKEKQWDYFNRYEDNFPEQTKSLSMAFFHIPLPEYLNFQSKHAPDSQNPMVGNAKEGITAPKYNSQGLKTLSRLGVKVVTTGHDHCNDFCLLDDSLSPANEDKIWLCFGGAAGEGGYAGYGGTERRIRIFELDYTANTIMTWKVLNSSPTVPFDRQTLVSDGIPKTDSLA